MPASPLVARGLVDLVRIRSGLLSVAGCMFQLMRHAPAVQCTRIIFHYSCYRPIGSFVFAIGDTLGGGALKCAALFSCVVNHTATVGAETNETSSIQRADIHHHSRVKGAVVCGHGYRRLGYVATREQSSTTHFHDCAPPEPLSTPVIITNYYIRTTHPSTQRIPYPEATYTDQPKPPQNDQTQQAHHRSKWNRTHKASRQPTHVTIIQCTRRLVLRPVYGAVRCGAVRRGAVTQTTRYIPTYPNHSTTFFLGIPLSERRIGV
ncbi:hypothetical protein IWX50DRAFT_357308 [Phyllosticta citricarpa]